MRALYYTEFRGPLTVGSLADPAPADHGVVIEVEASGICRSDWHGWMGHDPDIDTFPHVPGHELAGVVAGVGENVVRWKRGDRVTVPFVCGCGDCPECATGNHQICDHQTQPGFTHWGSFAQYVAIDHADVNLVALPDEMSMVTAASLGCRFATSFRAVVIRGRVQPGEWVAIHGCGGVGLSAVMIATALEAKVIAIDIDPAALALAQSLGAVAGINARDREDVVEQVRLLTDRGAHVSMDALGSAATAVNSVSCLRKRGRHVQVGLLAGGDYRPALPMEQVIARELEIIGSHGMQAHRYREMLELITSGSLQPQRLIGRRVALDEAPLELEAMGGFGAVGMTIIDRFK